MYEIAICMYLLKYIHTGELIQLL